jgi:hypothetical protein
MFSQKGPEDFLYSIDTVLYITRSILAAACLYVSTDRRRKAKRQRKHYNLPQTRKNFPLPTLIIGVPDPDPPDPHVFGPPGSDSISQRYASGSGFFYQQAKIVRKTLIPTVL